MELCTCTTATTTQAISKLSKILSPNNPARLRSKPTVTLFAAAQRLRGLHSNFRSLSYLALRAASSEDSAFTGVNPYVAGATEERESAVAVEDSPPPPEKNVYIESEAAAAEDPGEQSPAIEQLNEFLSNLNIKFDSEDTNSILLYGAGALVAVWLTSTVVGAIDSIPLFPKLMEVVGLGYTFWFTTRYLLFKKDREELAAKVEELKQQILGSGDD